MSSELHTNSCFSRTVPILGLLLLAIVPRAEASVQCIEPRRAPKLRSFTGEFPRNLVYWWEQGSGYRESARSRCWFVEEQGERRAARCVTEAGGGLLATPRRRLPPGEWRLETSFDRRSSLDRWDESWSFIVVDRVDHEPPAFGTLRGIRWEAHVDTGRQLLVGLDGVEDDSPVRLEFELEPQDGSGEVTRFSDSLVFMDFSGPSPEPSRKAGWFSPELLAGLERSFVAGAYDSPCGDADQVGLPRFGDAPVELRLRLVDAAGNAGAWRTYTIPAGKNHGTLSEAS